MSVKKETVGDVCDAQLFEEGKKRRLLKDARWFHPILNALKSGGFEKLDNERLMVAFAVDEKCV
jgi:hypothetical protein